MPGEAIRPSITNVSVTSDGPGSRGRNGLDPLRTIGQRPDTHFASRGEPIDYSAAEFPEFNKRYITRTLENLQDPLTGPIGPPSRPPHSPIGGAAGGSPISAPKFGGGPGASTAKAEAQQPQKTTSGPTSAQVVQKLASAMAQDMKESPQKAIDKGAVAKDGRVTPNKLEPAVQKELQGLIKDFREHSAGFSERIKNLGEEIAKDNLSDKNFKDAYKDFQDKYEANFGEGKDLFKEGFNAKEVIDSFQKAYDLSKGTRHQEGMDQIQQDIIDKYIKPMDSLARGDQGPALVARDKMKESLTGPNGAIDKLKQAGKNDKGLDTALDNLSKKLQEPGHGKTDLKEQREAVKTEIARLKNDSSLSASEKENLDKLSKQVDKASELYERMDKVAYAGVTEKDGKAVLDESNLGFKPEEASKDYFQYMQENHKEDIKSQLEKMNEQSKDLTPQEKEKAGTNIPYKDEDIKALETKDEEVQEDTKPTSQETNLADAETSFPVDEEDLVL
ncbi:MAG: hypothetical protein RLZZ361_425 [Cyanobacteriota bacterium]|jgi:chromosome segregation ATPase